MAQLKSTMLFNLEHRSILLEDCGRQMLTYGQRIEPGEMAEKISKVTADDVRRVLGEALQSRPTVVTFGADITHAPKYSDISAMVRMI